MMTEDWGIALLVEFHYLDMVGKEFNNASCLARFANGSLAIWDAEDCKTKKAQ
jgi:hypothetical protein